MIACLNANIVLMKRLMNAKANINLCNLAGMTAFHSACLNGKIDVVNILLENGADFLKIDHKKFIPLHYAIIKD